jgi:hypothetical protein
MLNDLLLFLEKRNRDQVPVAAKSRKKKRETKAAQSRGGCSRACRWQQQRCWQQQRATSGYRGVQIEKSCVQGTATGGVCFRSVLLLACMCVAE